MNEQEAIKRGYNFTGIYKRNREDAKYKADKIRKEGYKTVIVSEKASGYERSAGVRKGMVLGYSVYAEKRYFDDRSRSDIKIRLSHIPGQRENARLEYEKNINKINEEERQLLSRLKELEAKNPLTKANRREIRMIKNKLRRLRMNNPYVTGGGGQYFDIYPSGSGIYINKIKGGKIKMTKLSDIMGQAANPGAAWHGSRADMLERELFIAKQTGKSKKRIAELESRFFEQLHSADQSRIMGIANPGKKKLSSQGTKENKNHGLVKPLLVVTGILAAISYVRNKGEL